MKIELNARSRAATRDGDLLVEPCSFPHGASNAISVTHRHSGPTYPIAMANQRDGTGSRRRRRRGRGQSVANVGGDAREARLSRREADLAARECAVIAQEEEARALVREFGSTTCLGSEDVVMRVSELTTSYVKEVLRALWMAGRPDVASAMCSALEEPARARSRSPRRREPSESVECVQVENDEDEDAPDFG